MRFVSVLGDLAHPKAISTCPSQTDVFSSFSFERTLDRRDGLACRSYCSSVFPLCPRPCATLDILALTGVSAESVSTTCHRKSSQVIAPPYFPHGFRVNRHNIHGVETVVVHKRRRTKSGTPCVLCPYSPAIGRRQTEETFGCADRPAEKHCCFICCERKIQF